MRIQSRRCYVSDRSTEARARHGGPLQPPSASGRIKPAKSERAERDIPYASCVFEQRVQPLDGRRTLQLPYGDPRRKDPGLAMTEMDGRDRAILTDLREQGDSAKLPAFAVELDGRNVGELGERGGRDSVIERGQHVLRFTCDCAARRRALPPAPG
jgi:hypothetical protein